MKPIDMLICIQCRSEGCGPFRCRFSGVTHSDYRDAKYAEQMIRRDKEQPRWERDLKTGAGNG